MKHLLLVTIVLAIAATGWTQTSLPDTTHAIEGMVLSGIQISAPKTTSLHIESYSLKELQVRSPHNLSDALSHLPGLSQISTGNAISKPVVRGLFGNRVLVLLSGLRFDNQQFQDEHGMGLSQIGIDRVELIRGPASLLYGTDAVGGVINVIEQIPSAMDAGKRLDANVRLHSNTLGTLTDVGFSDKHHQSWYRIRCGYESHGDYSDGAGNRVYDSRNTGYYLKGGYGFRKGNWESNNAYNGSFNQYGFILDSMNSRIVQDARWSRAMKEPHHNVLLNILSSQNTFYLQRSGSDTDNTKGSVLKINAGLQSNKRAEDEGGGEISLDMHLLSILQSARWEKYLSAKTLLVLNEQATFEQNTNYGKRVIIPDAQMLEGNGSLFIRRYAEKLMMEGGFGITWKRITTLQTGKLNGQGRENQPFSTSQPAANGMLGISYNPSSTINLKGNVASGVRAGNLAELASEGLHEGSFRYEVGYPELKPEQNINADLTLEISKRHFFLSVSCFYNHFNNYIYLTPTTDSFNGIFQIFRYVQQDAKIYGGEANGIYRPISGLEIRENFSIVEGIAANDERLPFIPAWRSQSSVRWEARASGLLNSYYLQPELEYVFPQNNPAPLETATSDYALVHLHAGTASVIHGHDYRFSLAIHNLLNKTYADHLSRLKYFGLYNQGINAVLSVYTNLEW